MRWIATTAMLATILTSGTSSAGPADGSAYYGLKHPLAMCLFPFIHQHGPLYNYGPYYGYPPFEPYGNWNAYLQYTGPVPTQQGGAGAYGWIHGNSGQTPLIGGRPHLPSRGTSGGCATCGGGSWHGHKAGCSSCNASGEVSRSADPLERLSGLGDPQAVRAAYYSELPSLATPRTETAGYTGR